MRLRLMLFALLTGTCFASHAADNTIVFKITDALDSPVVKAVISPDLKIFLDEKDLPEYAERAKTDDYQRSGSTGTNRKQLDICLDAFASVIRALDTDAQKRQYDAVLITGSDGYGTKLNSGEYGCKPGNWSNNVRLFVQFIVTKDYAAKLAANPPSEPRWVPHDPKEVVISLSLESALKSAVVQKAMNPAFTLHFGNKNPPAYVQRFGPDDFEESGSMSQGKEGACQEAFANVIRTMISSAKDAGYNGIIKIRSYLDEHFARSEDEYECRPGHFTADVSLSGSFVTLK